MASQGEKLTDASDSHNTEKKDSVFGAISKSQCQGLNSFCLPQHFI